MYCNSLIVNADNYHLPFSCRLIMQHGPSIKSLHCYVKTLICVLYNIFCITAGNLNQTPPITPVRSLPVCQRKRRVGLSRRQLVYPLHARTFSRKQEHIFHLHDHTQYPSTPITSLPVCKRWRRVQGSLTCLSITFKHSQESRTTPDYTPYLMKPSTGVPALEEGIGLSSMSIHYLQALSRKQDHTRPRPLPHEALYQCTIVGVSLQTSICLPLRCKVETHVCVHMYMILYTL